MKLLLRMGPALRLPLDAVTRASCFTGQRGTGKTSSAAVLVEEASSAGAPSVIIDPTDVWWGLATSADGKGPGLGHVIFGGPHGHLPLREDAGAVMARLVVEQRLAAVFSIKHLRKGAQQRFVAEFMEELYHLNSEALLVVIDEAHRFAPRVQMEKGGYAQRCLGAVTDIATLGRANGLGIALVTQRLARLHTDVREACEIMVIKRLVGPNDRKAIEEWLADAGAEGETAHLRAILPHLPLERALVYAPGLGILGEFVIRMKRTFDSSETPEVGARKVEPRAAVDVDLTLIEAQIADTIEAAKRDDPKELRKQLQAAHAETAQAVRERDEARASAEPVEMTVEVPVRDEAFVREVGRVLNDLGELHERLERFAASFNKEGLDLARARLYDALERAPEPSKSARPAEPTAARKAVPSRSSARPTPPAGGAPARASAAQTNGSAPLGKAERRILSVLAQFPSGRTHVQLAMLTGYSHKSGGYRHALSSLRNSEPPLIQRGDPIRILPDGEHAIAGAWEPLPAGEALFEHWLGTLGKAERTILEVLRQHGTMDSDGLAELSGYSATSGGFRNALSRLRTLELIERGQPVALGEELAEAIA